MSDRQTPTSVMDRARTCILNYQGVGRPARVVMSEMELRALADEVQHDSLTELKRGSGLLTRADRRDQMVRSAQQGELYLWGTQVIIDDAAHEIRCEGATRGAEEYRGDQHAGVDNSVQAAQGCRVAAGVSDGADLCTLGTADLTTPTVLRQMRLLALWRWSEEDIAELLGMSLADLACAAWESEALLAALSPADHEREAYQASRDAAAEATAAAKRRHLAANPSARIRNAVAARMWAALKGKTDGALFSRLGYSPAELVGHLESQFSGGMEWANYGLWHVDHIRPCAGFDQTDPDQFRDCWALSNLQPLWAADNLRKGAKAWES